MAGSDDGFRSSAPSGSARSFVAGSWDHNTGLGRSAFDPASEPERRCQGASDVSVSVDPEGRIFDPPLLIHRRVETGFCLLSGVGK